MSGKAKQLIRIHINIDSVDVPHGAVMYLSKEDLFNPPDDPVEFVTRYSYLGRSLCRLMAKVLTEKQCLDKNTKPIGDYFNAH